MVLLKDLTVQHNVIMVCLKKNKIPISRNDIPFEEINSPIAYSNGPFERIESPITHSYGPFERMKVQ